MKKLSMLTRGLAMSVFLCLASTPIHAAPRTSTASPAQQFILRVNWGDSDSGGREDTMEIFGWSHEIVSPRDAASGLPTGKRQHKPFTISKALDKVTPLFMQAYIDNKLIPTMELIMVQTDGEGNEVPAFTIRLSRALVVSSSTAGGASSNEVAMEQISIVYEAIEWSSVGGTTSATDSWSTDGA